MKPTHKTIALWLVLILLFAGLFKVFDPDNQHRSDIKFSDFIHLVKEGKVEEVTFKSDNLIVGTFKDVMPDGKKYFETAGDTSNAKIFEILQAHDIIPNYERKEKTPFWQQILISWFPMLLLFLFFFLFMRQIQIGGGEGDIFRQEQGETSD